MSDWDVLIYEDLVIFAHPEHGARVIDLREEMISLKTLRMIPVIVYV